MQQASPKRANNPRSLDQNPRSRLKMSSSSQLPPPMNDARKRLDQTHVAHVEIIRDEIQAFFRRNSEISKAAVSEDSEGVVEAAFFAEMRVRVAAVVATVAAFVRVDSDLVSNFDRSNVAANFGDDSASFVAGDKDVANVGDVTVEDVAIRAANPAVRDFHNHI